MGEKSPLRFEIPDTYLELRGQAISDLGLDKSAFRISESKQDGFGTVTMGEIFEAHFLTDSKSNLVNVFEVVDSIIIKEDLSEESPLVRTQQRTSEKPNILGYESALNKINGAPSNEHQSDSYAEISALECLRIRQLQFYLRKATKYVTPFVKTVKYSKLTADDFLVSVTEVGHRSHVSSFFDNTDIEQANYLSGILFQMLHALNAIHSQALITYCDLPNGLVELHEPDKQICVTLKSDKLACIGKGPQEYVLVFSKDPTITDNLARIDTGNRFCKLSIGPYSRFTHELEITDYSDSIHVRENGDQSEPNENADYGHSDSDVFYSDTEDVGSDQETEKFYDTKSSKSTRFITKQLHDLSPNFSRDKQQQKNWDSRPETFFSTTNVDSGIAPIFTDVWDLAALFVTMCCSKFQPEYINQKYQFKKGREISGPLTVRDVMLLYIRIDYSRIFKFDPIKRLFNRFSKVLESKSKKFNQIQSEYVRDRLERYGIEELIGVMLWMKGLGYGYIPDDSERWEYSDNPFHIIMQDQLIVDYFNNLIHISVLVDNPSHHARDTGISDDFEEYDVIPEKPLDFTSIFSEEKLKSYKAAEQFEKSGKSEEPAQSRRWKPVNKTKKKIPLYQPLHDMIKSSSGTGCFEILVSMFNWVPDLRTVSQYSWAKPNYDGVSSRLPVQRSVRDLFSTDFFSSILNGYSAEKAQFFQQSVRSSNGQIHAYFERPLSIINLDGSDIIDRLKVLLLESRLRQ